MSDITPRQPQQLVAILTADELLLEWQPAGQPVAESANAVQREAFQRFHEQDASWLFHLGFVPARIELSESLAYWREFAAEFVGRLALTPDLESLRHKAAVAPPDSEWLQDCVANAPVELGFEYLSPSRLLDFWQGLNQFFQSSIRARQDSVESFLHSLRPDLELAGRVFFHLVENGRGAHPFAFMATYSTQVNSQGSTRHLPLKNAIREFAKQRDKLFELLAAVHRAARESALLTSLLESGSIFQPLAFDSRKALAFLKEVPLYEASGIRCRIPNWWSHRRSGASLSISIGDKRPAGVGLAALTSCVPGLQIDGQPITAAEARQLLELDQGLVMLKNKWVEVDREKLQTALDAYEQARRMMTDGMTMREALQLVLNPKGEIARLKTETTVCFGDWLREVTRKLRDPALVRQVRPADGFRASLRPYQQTGLNWLAFLDSLGFGACLADDMGLGKTIQVLAFLSLLRESADTPSLLVVPASLIGNWQDEIARFLPDLQTLVAHASAIGERARAGLPKKQIERHDLLITTYGMVHRCPWLREYRWNYLILDEAQAIKNPGTNQTRAVKKLQCRNRMILTGTPVENRLDDLWSLFDFLNPGLLGSSQEFKRMIANIHDQRDGYARLRQVTAPYILRRLKTDRSIISDLPEKIEMKTYATLSRRQIVLYRELVKSLEESLLEAEGIQRKGLVLASLMKFKQICNHPDQYLGSGDFQESDSGKFARLREICETVLAKREHILVFTQFREMVQPLDGLLRQVFGRDGLVMHGGVPVKQRRRLVEDFQRARDYLPYMILSLKTAGVGLNLTRANHVVHFDRWWNPAVENQATDRAFRIGQQRNVVVHKFVCRDTVEEKIDAMIESKSSVSEQVVAASRGEGWLTEMSNAELTNLFSLSADSPR